MRLSKQLLCRLALAPSVLLATSPIAGAVPPTAVQQPAKPQATPAPAGPAGATAATPTTAPAGGPEDEKARRYLAREAREKARKEREANDPNRPTTQALLQPEYPVAFAEAEKAIDRYKVASGLKMTVFAAEPQLQNPVALHVDDRNRVWVVETWRFDGGGPGHGVYDIRHMYSRLEDDLSSKTVQQRQQWLDKWNNGDNSSLTIWPDRLRLIEDRDGDGRADFASVFAEWKQPLEGLASGVITRRNESGGDDVYVTNIPSLFRLKDTDNDGKADEQHVVSTGYGVRYSLLGHDLHGLRWGPDGKLYFSNGDRGMHVKNAEGKTLDFPDEGTVMRCDPDGSNLEVFARGLRNPQKLVFDQYGNLFTGDNNCDYGDPARWVYVVEGGDTGWRIGYQHLQTPKPTGPWLAENLTALEKDNTAAYLIPPIAHLGAGPSGCTFYPGTGLSEKYNDHFFLTDFRAGPSSQIHSFALKPKGASFEMVDRKPFVERLIATDMEFGPDSAAYIADWNAGWVKSGKGRIYKVIDPEAAKSPEVAETKKLITEGMSKRAPRELQSLLGHRDVRVRQAAQFELAGRGTSSAPLLRETAAKSDKQLARVHAMWALGQLARKSPEAIKPLAPLLGDGDPEIRAQAAKLLGEAKHADAAGALVSGLKDPSPRVQYFSAIALGKLRHAPAVGPVLAMLQANDNRDAFLRHAGVMALTWIGDADAIAASARSDSAGVRMGACLALRRLGDRRVAQFLKDANPAIVTEAARAISDAPVEAAQPELAAVLGSVTLPEPVILRALHANFRLGAPANAAAVANFAARGDAPELMRMEALAMLREWDKPSGIDRVVGIWRPLPPRDPQIASNAARAVLPAIVTGAPDPVRMAAMTLIRKVGLDDANVLFDLVANKQTSPDVAAAALGAMDQRKDARLDEAVELALTGGRGSLRSGAIHLLARRPDAAQKLESLLSTGSIPDQQAVLTALGTIAQPAAQKLLSDWMDKLAAGSVAAELQLDVLEAAENSRFDDLKAKAKAYHEAKPKDDPMAAHREAIVGGDPALGRKIFFERQDVACMRCHKVDGQGGVAGPDLTGLASRSDRAHLLEAIVNPNAKISAGFESVTVRMKAGRNYTGVVKAETNAELVIDAGDGATVHVDKKEVDSRSKGLSPMPQDIVKPLSKRDVRDLVEFLATLKAPATQPAPGQTTAQTR